MKWYDIRDSIAIFGAISLIGLGFLVEDTFIRFLYLVYGAFIMLYCVTIRAFKGELI